MAFWDLHLAWFYQQLAVVGEWQSGYQDYAFNNNEATRSMHTHVPVQSFYVLAGYMLTGETRSQYGVVKPLRPFSLRPVKFGRVPGNSLPDTTTSTSATRSSQAGWRARTAAPIASG